MGEVEAAAGDAPAARAHFSRAVQLNPSMPHAYAAWARLELSGGSSSSSSGSEGDADGGAEAAEEAMEREGGGEEGVRRARQLYRAGAAACPGNAPLLHVSCAGRGRGALREGRRVALFFGSPCAAAHTRCEGWAERRDAARQALPAALACMKAFAGTTAIWSPPSLCTHWPVRCGGEPNSPRRRRGPAWSRTSATCPWRGSCSSGRCRRTPGTCPATW